MSTASYKNILFVDYENTGKVDLNSIPADVLVPFFFGASQKSVPTEFLKAALKLRDRFLPIDIQGQGKNALDFHISFYLGESLAANPQGRCVILSKDKGFDPLVKHLTGRGFAVRRAGTLAEAFGTPAQKKSAKKAAAADPKADLPTLFAAALQLLQGMQPRAHPRKRKGLVAHLHNHFGKKIPETELQKVVDRMIAEKRISETEGSLVYEL